MRIGIFGGTFDPIHLGHLILAERCREECQMDEVWFVPAALPPHKLTSVISSAKVRTEMIEFAIAGNPHFKVSRIELERTGPSYTVTTLEDLTREDPTRELFLLVGADSIHDLPTWREPQRILELATVVGVNRGRTFLREDAHRQLVTQLGDVASNRVRFVEMPAVDISATEIRQRVNRGASIRYLVPRAVEMYVAQERLYASPDQQR